VGTPDQLAKTLNLLALCAVRGMGSTEQIRLMSKAGFQPSEIADLLGIAAKTVSNRLVEIRKPIKQKEDES
jgi:hypothetical protein